MTSKDSRGLARDLLSARSVLVALFLSVLVAMLWVTVTASLERSVFEAGGDIWSDLWARATLFDAYFGFLTVYVWIFFRESSVPSRVAWFVLLMTLGNIAIAVYFLRALVLAPQGDWRSIFPDRQELPR